MVNLMKMLVRFMRMTILSLSMTLSGSGWVLNDIILAMLHII